MSKGNDFDLSLPLDKENPLKNYRELRDLDVLHWWIGTRKLHSGFGYRSKMHIRVDALDSQLIAALLPD